MINAENYRQFPAVANSDLTWLQQLSMPPEYLHDCTQAFKMGNGIDAYITEPHRIHESFKTFTLDGLLYNEEETRIIKEMKKAFYLDPFCKNMVIDASFQHISYNPAFEVEHEDIKFTVPAKAKWDIKKKNMKFGGDIKSTTATTMEQCLATVKYFHYDRSRAWYMDLEGHERDILIFISKVNFKVFIIPVTSIPNGTPAYEIYREGKAKYQSLCFDFWILFITNKVAA